MATTYTSSLRLALQGTGDNNNTWGIVANTVFDLVDQSVAGLETISITGSGDITLTTGNNTTDEARNAMLSFTGTPGANRNVIIPGVTKQYTVTRGLDGTNFLLTIKTTGSTATVTLAQGETKTIYCDATNVYEQNGTLVANVSALTTYVSAQVSALNTRVDVVSAALVGAAFVPTGAILPFAGSATPSAYLLCYGQEISRSTYAALFTAIGTAWGAGNGTTTFNVPDLRGAVPAGKDNMGGTSAGRLTVSGAGISGDVLGTLGGTQTQALSANQNAPHNHVIANGTSATTANYLTSPATFNASAGFWEGPTVAFSLVGAGFDEKYILAGTSASADRGLTSKQGQGAPFSIVQPSVIVNYIIKT